LDFSTLPLLDTDPASLGDFGSFLSTDGIAPSSSPKDVHVNFAYGGSDNVWAEWGGIEHKSTVQEKEK
jgi:hypothetical protein